MVDDAGTNHGVHGVLLVLHAAVYVYLLCCLCTVPVPVPVPVPAGVCCAVLQH